MSRHSPGQAGIDAHIGFVLRQPARKSFLCVLAIEKKEVQILFKTNNAFTFISRGL